MVLLGHLNGPHLPPHFKSLVLVCQGCHNNVSQTTKERPREPTGKWEDTAKRVLTRHHICRLPPPGLWAMSVAEAPAHGVLLQPPELTMTVRKAPRRPGHDIGLVHKLEANFYFV